MPERDQLRILVVEDDAISRRFLADALLMAGHSAVACADLAGAIAASAAHRFDLVLTDLFLPDGNGEDLIGLLRNDPASLNDAVPVVALSAQLSPRTRARLRELGFAAALEKPVAVGALERIVQGNHDGVAESGAAASRWGSAAAGAAHPAPPSTLPELDDDAALAVTGSPEILAGLRVLFRDELPSQLELVTHAIAIDDRESLRAVLHRLTAACGFCGAVALELATRQLEAALANPRPIPEAAFAAFREASRSCLARLRSDT